MNWFEKKLIDAKPVRRNTINTEDRKYKVNYIEPATMQLAQSFGYAYKDTIFVRADLSKRVEKFVINHEVYHLGDTKQWLGWFGRELRANIVCGAKDPYGLLATISASFTLGRLQAYGKALLHTNIKQE